MCRGVLTPAASCRIPSLALAALILGGLALLPARAEAQGPSPIPPPAGLVSWWPGNGNATDVQDGNNGTLQNGTTFGSGIVGQAFSFDGVDDGVLIGNPANLRLQDFTIDAWVRRSRLDVAGGGPLNEGGILVWGHNGWGLGLFPDGRLFLSKVDVDSVAEAAPRVTDLSFHHVAVTKAGTTVIFYVDGVPSAPVTYASVFEFDKTLSIGARLDVSPPATSTLTSTFAGLIDELQVFDRALTAAEVQAIFLAGSAGQTLPDDDGDGVPNTTDQCPGTPAGLPVNANGCATPVANAGPDLTVSEGAPVTLDGTGSSSPEGTPLTFSWVQTGGPAVVLSGATTAGASFIAPPVDPAGVTLTVQLTVSHGGATASDTVTVAVQDVPGNQAPVANAGPDQTVNEGTLVTLDGSGSVDPDGGPQPLGFAWVQLSGQVLALAGADTARPTFTAPPVRDGAHTLVFRLTVSDGALSATDTINVVVQALPASPLGCVPVRPRPGTLWPPNHQLVPVVLMWTALETPATVTVLGVTQDEPTEGTGDGDTAPDAEGIQGDRVHLRAERAGGGNGRFYHVTFRAERGAESCVGQVQVVVPPNLGRTTRPVDDGPRFDSATGAPLPLP